MPKPKRKASKPPDEPPEFVEVDTGDLEGGKTYFAELDAFWQARRGAPAVDLTPHYDRPGDQAPDRPSIDRLIGRIAEFLAITGPKAPPGFDAAAAEHLWAAEHNLLTLWAYSNFWFALADAGVTRESAFGDRVNRWPTTVEVALHLLLDVRATLGQRWGLTLEPGLKVELPGNWPHFPPVTFTCPGPLHPVRKGRTATIRPTGPLVVTGEEWSAMEWARATLDKGLAWKVPDETASAGVTTGAIQVKPRGRPIDTVSTPRNQWMYEQFQFEMKGPTWILHKLKEIAASRRWRLLGSPQAVMDRIRAHASRDGLELWEVGGKAK